MALPSTSPTGMRVPTPQNLREPVRQKGRADHRQSRPDQGERQIQMQDVGSEADPMDPVGRSEEVL